MFRLASMLYSIIATALAGAGVIAVLSAGYVSLTPILAAAAAGAVVAVPVAYLVARKLTGS
ncbi:hypothetical protein HKX54_15860 [Sulfitobacter sp. M57]|uniref:hypothetical protein n=1 Tax=unclassified Sulfitobacter TaxID=196795 RepID=UPI0023E3127C|nr:MULTISPECIES: hypothetical protein [unclassified Sulfitobacter]MDF3415945.1 hypothetical protein [Sulfitobacter sp. KE5]MDF3423425.1 hypothetical protein [Sulfitobacter sp. KE43]MDF3434491.1 hypothetical protein [Sulfitobacter sp. KE42]MDF3460131.1 hypothetical protein [Sulfitobacter sp. S74]MDF3464029.1 hypothetical protein [Sulfitobacter sp. Ks18]